jgi:hypothetical protein
MNTREKKAKMCMERAKATMGDGWAHIGPEIRWALVCAQIFGLLDAQDDDLSAQVKWSMFIVVKNFCHAMAHEEGWL